MSRWKKLDNWEEKLSEMTAEELEKELLFWKGRLKLFQPKIRTLAMKQVHTVQRALERRLSEEKETSTQSQDPSVM
jgi:hypothetical protein